MKTIHRRWLYNILPVLVAVFFVFAFAAFCAVGAVSYISVKDELAATNNAFALDFFDDYTSRGELMFERGARAFVEGFKDSERMELMVIGGYGKPIVSSGGFEVRGSEHMPDYLKALSSDEGEAFCRYRSPRGERLMAYTFLIRDDNGTTAGAVRYVVSLKNVDRQLINFALVAVVLASAAVTLVANSGLHFVSTVAQPVEKVNQAAKRMAHGDFAARVNATTYDDEIGQLSDTINEMAVQLGQTEQIKNEFISTISHEIRTPLTAIRGWSETINSMTTSDDPVVRKGMQVIISETERLSGMVEELLDFSRLQNGKLALKLEVMDALAELDESCLIFQERAEKEGVELLYTFPDVPAMLQGDANRIRQVFINILDNALKYNHSGGKITIEVDIKPEKVIIYIQDTGCGISEKDLPMVKEKFYKANDKVHGSGIGLAVADDIVRRHGGELKIDSVVDIGTTVTVILPLISA